MSLWPDEKVLPTGFGPRDVIWRPWNTQNSLQVSYQNE